MAIDIHWVFERRHRDGHWAAVLSDIRLLELAPPMAEPACEYTSALTLCRRHSPWFARLSVGDPEFQEPPIATPGLPEDASLYTRDYLEGDRAAIMGYKALRPSPFERHGCLVMEDARAAATPVEPGENPKSTVSHNAPNGHYLRRFIAHVEHATSYLEAEILFGRVRANPAPEHPDMTAASNHQRLDALSLKEGLLPISGSTLRWVIAFGS